MFRRRAELVREDGTVVATFNETCHDRGITLATVRLRSPMTLSGTQTLALFAQGVGEAVISVAASDPDGTEIREFHGTSAAGCVPKGTQVALVRSPGGDLGTLLIVLGTGTVESQEH